MTDKTTLGQFGDTEVTGHPSRFPAIQGLRALAVLLVIAFHAGTPLLGGFIGVDVFFVISGFVITRLLIRELEGNGRLNLARFYRNRFWRLVPAISVVVAVVVMVSTLITSPLDTQQITARTGLGALSLSANFVIDATTGSYFDAPASMNPLLNTWSLSVEEQFYLVFPAIVFLL